MNTSELKKFAQTARRQLIEQVGARLDLVLQTDSAELREKEKAVKQLRDEIDKSSREAVVERVAYLWFNRFCALRFMDVNRYTRVGTVSPAEGYSQPEILQDAKQGHIEDELQADRKKVFDLRDGQAVSADPQQVAYRLLLVAACNSYHKLMPFMFQRISDFSELLMPDDLLSDNSILQLVRAALNEETCRDVEVIGWLYQFYISEKKDKVFAGLKKNKKITPENIPAATQLFTPHWIVRYLVENSLGRLWMLNHPDSRLIDRMEYYIDPAEQKTTDAHGCTQITEREKISVHPCSSVVQISSPEEIKICDPACGSGHMLTYAFDLLYAIYEEEGYDSSKIPQLILSNNLYGIEIDERAGELAAFALMMKAREYDRRFFRRKVMPNICVLENIELSSPSGQSKSSLRSAYLSVVSDQLKEKLLHDLHLFREANNFGSLLRPQLSAAEIAEIQELLTEHWQLNTENSLFDAPVREKIRQALLQAEYLTNRYHVVIANPPYMGGKGMNGSLKTFAQKNYKKSKSDLFAMFIERNLDLAQKQGMVAMITMQSWMFLSSFEKLRNKILDEATIISMAHLGARAFDSIGGEVVSTTAFVLENAHHPEYKGAYIRLVDGISEQEKADMLLAAIEASP